MPTAFVCSGKCTPEGIYRYSYFLLPLRKENWTETDGGKKHTPMKSTMLISAILLLKSRGPLFPNNKSSLTFSLNFSQLSLSRIGFSSCKNITYKQINTKKKTTTSDIYYFRLFVFFSKSTFCKNRIVRAARSWRVCARVFVYLRSAVAVVSPTTARITWL